MLKLSSVEVDIDSPLSEFYESSPEKRLAAAVLERAICDYHGNCRQERSCAYKWFVAKDTCSMPFSFCWVAETLGFEKGAHKKLRRKIFDLDTFKFHSRTKPTGVCRRVVYHSNEGTSLSLSR